MSTPSPTASRSSSMPSHSPAGPVVAPSVHVRVMLTWLAIFPLVSVGMVSLGPLWSDWHPVLRALLLTAVVVPLAVYVVVPQLLRAYGAAARSRRRRPRTLRTR